MIKERIESIDFLRGIAALSVVLYHITHTKGFLNSEGIVYNFFKYFGGAGVSIFFVISGFILPYSMLKSNYRIDDFRKFIFKRIIRIEPVFIASIFFTVFVFYAASQLPSMYDSYKYYKVDFMNFILHFGYLISFFKEQSWINPVFWSLGIEFQFYLIIGVIYPLIVIKNKYVNILVLGVIVLISWYISTFFVKGSYLYYGGVVFRYIPMFFIGILLFQFKQKKINKKILSITLILLLSILITDFRLSDIIAVVFAILVIIRNSSTHSFFKFLGKISFSLYLIHIPIGGFIMFFIKAHFSNDLTRTILILLTTIPIIAISYVFYMLIEEPSMKWSKNVQYRKANLEVNN